MAKVLVVDDSLSVRKVVERALVGRHIEVMSAASGNEAIERIERDSPDVVVCDVVMPDRDGYEICAFVKSHPRLGGTPVLLMSGIVNDEVRAKALAAHSAGVLAKPFAADDLLKQIEALLPKSTAPAVAAAPPPAAIIAPAAPTLVTAAPAAPAMISAAVPGPAAPGIGAPPPLSITPRVAAAAAVTTGAPPLAAAGTGAPAGAAPAPPSGDVKAIVEGFAAIDGVQWAVIADREGFVMEATAAAGIDADVAAALSACLAESSEGLGRELGRGALSGMILEYDKGIVVLYGAGTSALLAVGLADPAALGKVRYYAKRALSDLARMV